MSGRAVSIEVPKSARGERLDRFLASHVPGLSVERARSLCEQGQVRIAGHVARSTRKLWGGERIDLERPSPAPAAPVADEGLPIPVLFEDPTLVVIDKPAGLVVERDTSSASVVGLLASRLSGFDCAGVAEPGVVHRLDRDTTGCLALAKTDAARAALLAAFAAKEIDKRYLAIVLGRPPDQAEIDTPYGRAADDPRRFTTRVRSARRARLSYETIERFENAALLSIALDTGRTHQIRVQLSEAGFPLLGDAVYGTHESHEHPAARPLGRQALHAKTLTLPHPATREPLAFESPLPEDFRRALDFLRTASARPT